MLEAEDTSENELFGGDMTKDTTTERDQQKGEHLGSSNKKNEHNIRNKTLYVVLMSLMRWTDHICMCLLL